MRLRIDRRWPALLAVLCLAAAACGGSDDSGGQSALEGGATTAAEDVGEPVQGGNLRVVHYSNPSSLDPIAGGSGGDHVSLYPLYDRLVNFEPDTMQALPGLAESWEFTDPQTLVFQLRQGVTFHDGTPFDAAAVKFNLERAKSGEVSRVKAELESVDSVEATATHEVTLHLNRPDSALVLIFADRTGMMVSPTAAQAAGADFSLSPVGTGPFKFVEWLPNDRLELEAYEGYWQDGKPYVDTLTMRYMTDSQTGNNALLAGEADFKVRVEPADVESLERQSGITIASGPSLYTWMCYLNFAQAPFDNVKARQAFNIALDREELNTGMLFGQGEPATQIFPPNYWAYQDGVEDPWPHDAEAAKALLAEAGLEGTDVRGLILDAPGYARMGEIVQAQVNAAGFNMTLETMEVGAGSKAYFEDNGHDTLCAAWTGRPDPIQPFTGAFSSAGYYNAGKYQPEGFDQLIADATVSADPEERAAAFEPLMQVVSDEALYAPLVHAPAIDGMRENVHGYVPNLYGKPDVSFLWLSE
ncbi:MAG: hypothetical protein GEV08_22905 [Acidimicrobiia bacterium]|nr:hypothetical protein [Acidimicrobiia bacterium]